MANAIETVLAGQSIPIPCPHCGKETKKKVGWLKKNPNFVCSGCGATVVPEADKFFDGLAKADKLFKDAFRRRR